MIVRRCHCGTPVGSLQNYCSTRCFYEDEPGARDEEQDQDERDF